MPISRRTQLSSDNRNHTDKEESTHYSQKKPANLIEDEQIVGKGLKQAKQYRYCTQNMPEEREEFDDTEYTNSDNEENSIDDGEDFLSEDEMEGSLDDDYLLNQVNENDEEEWLGALGNENVRAIEATTTKAADMMQHTNKPFHLMTARQNAPKSLWEKELDFAVDDTALKESKNEKDDEEQKLMKQELELLKRAELNRRRKARKERELDENHHATIEKLLKRSNRKNSDTGLDSDQLKASEEELCRQRREEMQKQQRDLNVPLIRYTHNLNGTILSFPMEIITDLPSAAPSSVTSTQWFQRLLTLE
jgi:hypothetical protein